MNENMMNIPVDEPAARVRQERMLDEQIRNAQNIRYSPAGLLGPIYPTPLMPVPVLNGIDPASQIKGLSERVAESAFELADARQAMEGANARLAKAVAEYDKVTAALTAAMNGHRDGAATP